MKNKKGFTLIELLAVIVILAIIALIAVPIILNMISQARKSAARSSALGYVDSIEYYAGFHNVSSDTEITGYNVPLPEMTEGSVTCKKTSSGWDNNCKAFFEAVDKKSKGKKPDTAEIIISSTGKVQANSKMTFNGYEVTYDGKDADVGGSSSSSSESTKTTVPDPVSFATDSWETIAANPTSYNVGDEREVEIGSKSYTVRIANTSTPSECSTTGYSQTACGFVIEFVDIVESRQMNTSYTNAGGWKETAMRTYLNGDFYNNLPEELRNVIIPTNPVVSGSGSGGVSENTSDKIYLLSTREVGFDLSYDNKRDVTTDTRILDYYNSNNNNAARRKKDLNGDAQDWWLRSACSSNTGNFYSVGTTGNHNYHRPDDTYGVAPAFHIGK